MSNLAQKRLQLARSASMYNESRLLAWDRNGIQSVAFKCCVAQSTRDGE
jgi:hypothetical protein